MTEKAAQQPNQQFGLQRIYIKDLSFEAPKAPEVFKSEWKPEINLEINNKSEKVEGDIYEIVLSMTVTVKNKNEIAFIVEIQQAGLFLIAGVSAQQMQQILGAYCPNILFPYAREAVSDIVGKGSFPQLLLAPVNFDALYAEAVKRKTEQANKEAETAAKH
ncbi:MAG: protein-export chaperone SecB [Pseudomonadales bacterium]|nr:protein-export chaperone SecB [Pseudomonadales bacterium]